MNVKYSLISFCKAGLGLSTPFIVDSSTYINAQNVTDLFDTKKTEHWQGWLGKLRWDELKHDGFTLITWMPTETPDILDAESKELTQRIKAAWYATLLGEGQPPFYGLARRMTGAGTFQDGKLKLTNLREYAEMDTIERPFYDYCNVRYIRQRSHVRCDPAWPKEIAALYVLLEQRWRSQGVISSIIYDALASWKDARCSNDPGTAIARYVEAAEAVLAMPKGRAGSREFVRRAMKILAPYTDDPYLDWTESEIRDSKLPQLYQLRNSRNHGKGTHDSVRELVGCENEDMINDAVGKWFYLAESLARKAIRQLLEHPNGAALAERRANLEAAWETGAFPASTHPATLG